MNHKETESRLKLEKDGTQRDELFARMMATPFIKAANGEYALQVLVDGEIVTIILKAQPI
jgi:hypothetical protein